MRTTKKSHQKIVLWVLSIILFLQIGICNAQNQVSGHVFSAKDSTAIFGGMVYFEGTSIGEAIDHEGYFKILFKENNSSLIISSVGYEPVVVDYKKIKTNTIIPNIYLSEKLEELETVYLEIDRWSRAKKLRIFKREFLGSNESASLCKIMNEDAIKLRYINSSNTLTVTSEEPLIIENKYLGYLLTYNLRDFEIKFTDNYSNDSTEPMSIHYHGFSFFKPLKKRASRKILRNRKKSYLGSSFHFMRALYSKELDENNFKIFYKKTQIPTYKYLKIIDDNHLKRVELLVKSITILHKEYEYSILSTKGDFTLDSSGHYAPPEAISLSGKMSQKRISELLPFDYDK